MSTQTDQDFQIRPAERANFLLYAVFGGAIVGGLLGWLLPKTVWRTGGTTVLGDFALVCLFCLSIWVLSTVRVSRGALVGLAASWLVIFAFREVAWRFWPLALAIFYGMSVVVLILLLLGDIFYEARLRSRAGVGISVDQILTPERFLSLILGIIFLIWLCVAAIFGLIVG